MLTKLKPNQDKFYYMSNGRFYCIPFWMPPRPLVLKQVEKKAFDEIWEKLVAPDVDEIRLDVFIHIIQAC